MNKIPVGQTIAETYRFTFAGVERVIGVIWLPILILTVGGYFVMGPYLTAESALLEGDISQFGPAAASMFAFEIVSLIMLGVIGVAITREVLNPLQRPLFLRFGLGGAELRLAGAFVGLFVLTFVFVIICVVIAAVAGSALGAALPATPGLNGVQRALGVGGLVGLCLLPVLFYLFVRLSFLVAPSVTMEGKFGIERSWELTKGNFWRIFVIGVATFLPLVLVTVVIELMILGPDYFQFTPAMLADKAAQARHSAEQIGIVAHKLPYLMGLSFVLAPFSYGLMFSAPAFAWRALTGRQ
ncbi:MAG TPA: hypothetical protein VMU01_04885 [Rhizomicrobium sp.]|nr:hypothetical protein [Rhizomicrobium sp.]